MTLAYRITKLRFLFASNNIFIGSTVIVSRRICFRWRLAHTQCHPLYRIMNCQCKWKVREQTVTQAHKGRQKIKRNIQRMWRSRNRKGEEIEWVLLCDLIARNNDDDSNKNNNDNNSTTDNLYYWWMNIIVKKHEQSDKACSVLRIVSTNARQCLLSAAILSHRTY